MVFKKKLKKNRLEFEKKLVIPAGNTINETLHFRILDFFNQTVNISFPLSL